MVIGALLCFSVGVELAEHMVYRDVMEWYDVASDSMGVLAGAAVSWLALRRLRLVAGL